MKNTKKILLWSMTISLGLSILSSIPLFVNYLTGTEPKFPLFSHIHVWFGALFVLIVITRIIINRKTLKLMLK